MKTLVKTHDPFSREALISMNNKILEMKALALALEAESGQFPGIAKNTKRVLATIKMMELNLCDALLPDMGV